MKSRSHISRRRGIAIMDVTLGVMLIGALGSTIIVALGRHDRAMHRLAESRNDMSSLESALSELQMGQKPASNAFRVETISGATAAPEGHAWVRITATQKDSRASTALVGLVSRANLPAPTTQEVRP